MSLEKTKERSSGSSAGWIEGLEDEDLMFVKRFVLASGSLKAIAEEYGISYPTVRLRLDRLIQKIGLLDDHRLSGPFERRLRSLYAERRIDLETLKLLLLEHQRELEGQPIDTGDKP